jgi:hypothetical protein
MRHGGHTAMPSYRREIPCIKYELEEGKKQFGAVHSAVEPSDSTPDALRKLVAASYNAVTKYKPGLSRKERRKLARTYAKRQLRSIQRQGFFSVENRAKAAGLLLPAEHRVIIAPPAIPEKTGMLRTQR